MMYLENLPLESASMMAQDSLETAKHSDSWEAAVAEAEAVAAESEWESESALELELELVLVLVLAMLKAYRSKQLHHFLHYLPDKNHHIQGRLHRHTRRLHHRH